MSLEDKAKESIEAVADNISSAFLRFATAVERLAAAQERIAKTREDDSFQIERAVDLWRDFNEAYRGKSQ
jgi:hypothetical protein